MLAEIIPYVGGVTLAYLFGSIPFAVLLTHLFEGEDIRRLGTRNPGAANVFREVGQIAGMLVGILDMLKGAIPVLTAAYLLDLGALGGALAGIAAVTGHQLSVFLRFHGGAGLATATGAIAALLPGPFLTIVALGAALALLTRNMGWTGGTLLALTLGLGSLAAVTPVPLLVGDLRVKGLGPVYAGFAISALLLLHFWARVASEWWRGRGEEDPTATEGQRRSG